MKQNLLFAWVMISGIILAATFPSCKKSNSDTVPPVTQTIDTIAQKVYTLSRADASNTGVILICPTISSDSSILMIMDGAGHLLKQKYTRLAACFNRWNINGTTRYTWIENDPTKFHAYPDMAEGEQIIADENLNILQRISLKAHDEITTNGVNDGADMHDFILLGDNHYLMMSYYPKTVTNIPASLTPQSPIQVITPVIQEVKDGQVIWQWDASNYPEFYTTSVEGNNYYSTGVPLDYMHMNSMFIDPKDNNLICSFRNLDQVIKIDRQTGDILWRLGGTNSDFPLASDQYSQRQHNATLTDNNHTLLVFDNGMQGGRAYTRILEYQLDEVNKQVTSFKSYQVPEAQSFYMGSVQKLGNHYFISGGSAGYVLELDYTTGEKILEMKGPVTYRAYKY